MEEQNGVPMEPLTPTPQNPDAQGAEADEARIREEAIARREAEVTRRELRAQALTTLADKRLPTELAELLDYADAQRFSASLARVQKLFAQAVQKGVETRVAGAAPKAGSAPARGSMRDAISAYYNR